MFAEPQGGAVTDLNVMTRRGHFESRLTRALVSGSLRLTPQPGTRLVVALADFTVRGAAANSGLATLDALLIDSNAGCELQARAASASLYLIEIIATA